MHHPLASFFYGSGILFLALLIANGCVRGPNLQPSNAPHRAPVASIAKPPPSPEADRLLANGDFEKAALAYQRLANNNGSPRQLYLRNAVSAWTKAGQLGKAESLYDTLAIPVSAEGRAHKQLLAAELALAKGHDDRALSLLSTPPRNLPSTLQAQYYMLRAQALRQNGQLIDSAYALIRVDALLSSLSQRERNQGRILQTLTLVSEQKLKARIAPPPDAIGGWMALARIVQHYRTDSRQGESQLAAWQRSYRGHPARRPVIEHYTRDFSRKYPQARQIAMLLPATGAVAKAADALRNGFLASYLAHPDQRRPIVRFYPTGDPSRIGEVYRQAVSEGADLVIGPLRKKAVAHLAKTVRISVPTLALNRLPEEVVPLPKLLYQFGLSPEEEAHQAAQLALRDGHRRALVLVPNNAWGERMAYAFRQRWRELGGSVSLHLKYPPATKDFAAVLQRLLAGNDGPRSKGGADFLFLAARPKQARRIRPALHTQHAGNLPIYATSHIYTGTQNPRRDNDLNGILFCDIPWLFTTNRAASLHSQDIERFWPEQRNSRYIRLYALGMDSFLLSGQLAYLHDNPEQGVPGNTGTLYVQKNRQVRRKLAWASFQGGTPQLVRRSATVRKRPNPLGQRLGRHP